LNYITKERFEESPEIMLRVGDVLVAKDGSTLGITALVKHLPGPATVNSSIAVIRINAGHNSSYLAWLFQSSLIQGIIAKTKAGMGVPHLFQADLRKFPVLLPPKSEQSVIAAFLDRETAKIDALIEKQERLLELLDNKREALITEVLAKGLGRGTPMKPCGIPWLGDIPAHWEIKTLKRISASLQTGPFGSQLKASDYVKGGIPVINPANILEESLCADAEVSVDSATAERLNSHRLREGDLVIGRRGKMGRAAVVSTDRDGWLCGTGALRARLDRSISHPGYVVRQMRLKGVAEWLELQAVGSTLLNLNTTMLGRMPLVLPPREEQEEIEGFLRIKLASISNAAERGRVTIDLFRERRAALITAAVTGQIDVCRPSAVAEAAE
jgi:type I restriction enzyme S subunit